MLASFDERNPFYLCLHCSFHLFTPLFTLSYTFFTFVYTFIYIFVYIFVLSFVSSFDTILFTILYKVHQLFLANFVLLTLISTKCYITLQCMYNRYHPRFMYHVGHESVH